MISSWVPSENLTTRLDCYRYQPEFIQAENQLKNASEPHCCLDDLRDPLAPINNSLRDMTHALVDNGVPVIRGTNIAPPWVENKDLLYIDAETDARSQRSRLSERDIVICAAGSIGAHGLVPRDLHGANINSSCARFRASSPNAAYFLAAFLSTETGQRLLVRESVGSVQRHLNLEDLPDVMVLNPSDDIQQAIGNKLRKAERHRAIAAALARRKFVLMNAAIGIVRTNDDEADRRKGWRVDASDVEMRLDAEYYLPEYIDALQTLRNYVRVSPLSDIEIGGSYGVLPSSDEYGHGDLPLIRGMDLTGSVLSSVPSTAPRVPDTYYRRRNARLTANEIMLLIKGATIDAPQSVGVVSEEWNERAIANGSIYKFSVKEPNDPYYVCAFLGSTFGLMQKRRAVANTGISYNDQEAIRRFEVALPDVEIQVEIGNVVRDISRHESSAGRLVAESRRDVDALLDGTYAVSPVEDENIESWLNSHPVPSE